MLVIGAYHIGGDVNGRAYMFVGCISQFTADGLYFIVRQAYQFACIIFNAKEYLSAKGVCKCYHLLGDFFLPCKLLFKLDCGGFTTTGNIF